jgi:hypothetical protein
MKSVIVFSLIIPLLSDNDVSKNHHKYLDTQIKYEAHTCKPENITSLFSYLEYEAPESQPIDTVEKTNSQKGPRWVQWIWATLPDHMAELTERLIVLLFGDHFYTSFAAKSLGRGTKEITKNLVEGKNLTDANNLVGIAANIPVGIVAQGIVIVFDSYVMNVYFVQVNPTLRMTIMALSAFAFYKVIPYLENPYSKDIGSIGKEFAKAIFRGEVLNVTRISDVAEENISPSNKKTKQASLTRTSSSFQLNEDENPRDTKFNFERPSDIQTTGENDHSRLDRLKQKEGQSFPNTPSVIRTDSNNKNSIISVTQSRLGIYISRVVNKNFFVWIDECAKIGNNISFLFLKGCFIKGVYHFIDVENYFSVFYPLAVYIPSYTISKQLFDPRSMNYKLSIVVLPVVFNTLSGVALSNYNYLSEVISGKYNKIPMHQDEL